ncbi:MAG: hypothetical protein OEL53_07375 [Rhodospirillales bacterium]|nr:hypothetical protein [Rhodospirillales bacterium]
MASTSMGNDSKDNKLQLRLPLIMHAYLSDLADMGAFGRGKSGVAVRFIEDGVRAAISSGVLGPKSVKDFEEGEGEQDASKQPSDGR